MAVETADVVLMTEDMQKIPHMIRVSRQFVFTIQQNFYGTLSVVSRSDGARVKTTEGSSRGYTLIH